MHCENKQAERCHYVGHPGPREYVSSLLVHCMLLAIIGYQNFMSIS
jgi:hypothetical protein